MESSDKTEFCQEKFQKFNFTFKLIPALIRTSKLLAISAYPSFGNGLIPINFTKFCVNYRLKE